MVIDDRSNEPVLMTAGTWKDRKDSMEFMTVRTCKNHGMDDCALRTRSSVLHRSWRDHISDKTAAEMIHRQMRWQDLPYQKPHSYVQ